ncbi:MAG: transposase [Verrucomicrobiota bacterium]|jgi:transposase
MIKLTCEKTNRTKAAAKQALRSVKEQTDALVETILSASKVASVAGASAPNGVSGPRPHQVIKLGIDVHLDRYVVVRQIDGGAPQPAQGFSPAQFLDWARKQTALARQVYSCYEAGPFGYSLHRKLAEFGITNYVVRPRDWDEYGKNVKTDKRDAKQMVLGLDRYVAGNQDAFCVVRVPTEAQEQARSRSRQRESLQKEKQRLAAQGRSHALYYGAHIKGLWWTEALWKELVLPAIVLELLEPLRRLIEAVDQELRALSKALTEAAPADLPVGLGKLTYEVLEREVSDWNRFDNRRQVASYTGMCPREDSSAQRRFQGSINKHDNPRVRTVLVEASWRLMQYQPTCKPVAKWLPVLANPKTTRSKRKQIAVAIGRQFSVDWWRVRTGRCKAADLGLKTKPETPAVAPAPPARKTKAAQNSKDGTQIPSDV